MQLFQSKFQTLQRNYHEIDSEINFLIFKAAHRSFSLLCKNNIDETRTLV